jgi:hypothetical protein
MIPGLPVPRLRHRLPRRNCRCGSGRRHPTRTRDLSSRPNAAATYAIAVARASAQQAFDDSVAVPQGRSFSSRTDTARRAPSCCFTDSPTHLASSRSSPIALCAGDNVYVPRLPHHSERGATSAGWRTSQPRDSRLRRRIDGHRGRTWRFGDSRRPQRQRHRRRMDCAESTRSARRAHRAGLSGDTRAVRSSSALS